MRPKSLLPLLLAFASLGLTACNDSDPPRADGKTGWAAIAEEAQADIREEMANKDLDVGKHLDGLPRASLSPQGDLLLDGEKVALTDAQRERLLAFRAELAHLAEAGAALGLQAAELATVAMKESAKAAFGGDTQSLEARMEKESEAIKVAALALCDRLPALLETQRLAAEAVPEFRPYATMTVEDMDDCNNRHEGDAP